jgi:hypothetical protein
LLAISQENAPSSDGGVPAGGGRGGRGGPPAPATPAPTAPAEGRGGTAAVPERVPGKIYATEADFEKAIQPDSQAPWPAHGFLAKAKVEQDNWITAGMPDNVYALVSGSAIYTPIKVDRGTNAVVYAGPETVMASGYSWEEFRKQLAYKPLLVTQREGRGYTIGFTADPNYRGYMDGLNLLFINAVFRGPAHTGGFAGGGQE